MVPHTVSLEQRQLRWKEALESGPDRREGAVAELGVWVLGRLGQAVDVYREHDDKLERTFVVLDRADQLASLLNPYAALDDTGPDGLHPEDFLALITARLARIRRSDSEDAAEASDLFEFWRGQLYGHVERDRDTLTVAEAAALFGITPQAVYKWINNGSVELAESGTDGRKRILASSLRTTRDQERAIDRWRAGVRERRGGIGVGAAPTADLERALERFDA